MGDLEIVALVPARAGSVGLPGKNTLRLAGVPLWLRAVEQGSRFARRTVLSTDIEGVGAFELPQSTVVLDRPAHLAGSEVGMADVVHDVLDRLAIDDCIVILLQPTSPLRSDRDIAEALEMFMDGDFDMVLSLCESDRSLLKNGMLNGGMFVPVSDPGFCFTNRQSLPATYRPNGAIYVFRARDFRAQNGFPHRQMGGLHMPPDRSIDIDSRDDFDTVARMLANRRGSSDAPAEELGS